MTGLDWFGAVLTFVGGVALAAIGFLGFREQEMIYVGAAIAAIGPIFVVRQRYAHDEVRLRIAAELIKKSLKPGEPETAIKDAVAQQKALVICTMAQLRDLTGTLSTAATER